METVGVKGAVVEALGFLEIYAIDEGWIEPTTRSTGASAGGLALSMLGQGSCGIKSYTVLDWEYKKSRY